eukprot:TRINITY_DN81046_c0_g1_i1.p1 TRINITY_DN81046_c0_g1~~TRINITY_DN81046_c0_g1_i1.p1  ORF type:complete len:282 (-),score=95.21 TRINITY_DN81046_c0_g1_i1:211-1056(-)
MWGEEDDFPPRRAAGGRRPMDSPVRGGAAAAGGGGGVERNIRMDLERLTQSIAQYGNSSKKLGTSRDTREFRVALEKECTATRQLAQKISQDLNAQRGVLPRDQFEKFKAQFNLSLKRFETLNKDALRKEQEVVAISKSMKDGGDGFGGASGLGADDPFREATAPRDVRLQMDSHKFDESLTQFNMIDEQTEDIVRLEENLEDLHSMYLDMATLVDEQQDGLDHISANIGKSVSHVDKGVDELQKAEKYQKKARKKMCILIIIALSVAAGVILLSMALTKK